jgi:hypothetical protein
MHDLGEICTLKRKLMGFFFQTPVSMQDFEKYIVEFILILNIAEILIVGC